MSYIFRLLAAVILTGFALFGQLNETRDLASWNRSQDVWSMPPESSSQSPHYPHSGSNIVSIRGLSHKVPGKARKEMEKAEKALLNDQRDTAISHYNQAILIDPEFVAARNNLAVEYFYASNTERGIEQLEQAVKIDPHNQKLFSNLALGNIMIRRFDDAERAARMALNLDRTDARARMLLGVALVDQHKFTEEALRCFERTFDFDPTAHLLAGSVLFAQGDLERAKSEIRTYLASGEQDDREVAARWLHSLDQQQPKSAEPLSAPSASR
jgi:tetratricopeptide (TPR) repeat protein